MSEHEAEVKKLFKASIYLKCGRKADIVYDRINDLDSKQMYFFIEELCVGVVKKDAVEAITFCEEQEEVR